MQEQEQNSRIIYLVYRFIHGETTEPELVELQEWRNSSEENELWFSHFTRKEVIMERLSQKNSINTRAAFKKTLALVHEGKDTRIVNLRLWPLVATFVLLAGIVAFFLVKNADNKGKQLDTYNNIEKGKTPTSDRAMLTLADGSVIVLDTTLADGVVGDQGIVQVIKKAGALEYIPGLDSNARPTLYNTLTTPRGQQYRIKLPDGSTAWLNAASSIRFPLTYPDKERVIEMTGEVYVEVAKDPTRPFRIRVNGIQVEALGTSFNVKAYKEDKTIKTTLLTGKIKITGSGIDSRLDTAGQMATIDSLGHLTIQNVDEIEKAVDWKNGMFYFERDDIKTAMSEISRWYGVDLLYKNVPPVYITHTAFQRSSSLDVAIRHLMSNDSTLIIYNNGEKLTISSKR